MKHAILGFLIDQPMHGYELKRRCRRRCRASGA